MFEKLTFASQEERDDFEKYKKLKGLYLHKQVYDILLEANCGDNVAYRELSSIIRYDKNLRDTLYIYLATAEEYLRALLCEKYDVKESCKQFKGHCFNELKETLFEKIEGVTEKSNLYLKLEPDFLDLMRICVEMQCLTISDDTIKHAQNLRNHVLHHAVLIVGKTTKYTEFLEHLKNIETRICALKEILPKEYIKGFGNSIKKLNGPQDKPYLSRFYLEVRNESSEIHFTY